MDLNYQILKLEELLDNSLRKIKNDNGRLKLRETILNILGDKENLLTNNEELNKYSKEAIKLLTEKNLLLATERKVSKSNNSYWEALKNKTIKMNSGLLSHFIDDYVSELSKEKEEVLETTSTQEINDYYNVELKSTIGTVSKELDSIASISSSIELNHMENLNSNGRTISTTENSVSKKLGGIFLKKDSNISYGKFVNKKDFLNTIKEMKKTSSDGLIKNISINEFSKLLNHLNQTIKIDKNEKIGNQDARLIKSNDKNLGSLFLGNKGIDLPNGEYVSMEEVSFAISNLLKKKEAEKKKHKVIKRKGKLKSALAVASLTATVLAASFANEKNSDYVYDETQTNIETVDTEIGKYISPQVNAINEIDTEVVTKDITNFVEPNVLNPKSMSLENINLDEPITVASIPETFEENNISLADENIVPPLEEKEEETIAEDKQEENNNVEEPTDDIDKSEEPTQLENTEQENISNEEEIKDSIEETVVQSSVSDNAITEEANDVPTEEITETSVEGITENEVTEPVEELAPIVEQPITEVAPITPEMPVQETPIEEAHVEEPEVMIDVTNSAVGQAVAAYATQFVGNPYEYGGESLTNGIDCSGFTRAVYANFGVDLPHSSSAQRNIGIDVGKDINNALPGDLICYDGHVALYIGNGQIVHASGEKTGIKISDAGYRDPLAIRRPIAMTLVGDVNSMQESGKTM